MSNPSERPAYSTATTACIEVSGRSLAAEGPNRDRFCGPDSDSPIALPDSGDLVSRVKRPETHGFKFDRTDGQRVGLTQRAMAEQLGRSAEAINTELCAADAIQPKYSIVQCSWLPSARTLWISYGAWACQASSLWPGLGQGRNATSEGHIHPLRDTGFHSLRMVS